MNGRKTTEYSELVKTFKLTGWQQDAYDKISNFIDNPQFGINKVGLNWTRSSGSSVLVKRLVDKFDYIVGGNKKEICRLIMGTNCEYVRTDSCVAKYLGEVSINSIQHSKNPKVLIVIDAIKLEKNENKEIIRHLKDIGIEDFFTIVKGSVNPSIQPMLYSKFVRSVDYLHEFYSLSELFKSGVSFLSYEQLEAMKKDNEPKFYSQYNIGEEYIKNDNENKIEFFISSLIDKISLNKATNEDFNNIKMLKELIFIRDSVNKNSM